MTDPKVGDKVKVTGSTSSSSRALKGRVGTITRISQVNKFVVLDIERNLPMGGGGLHFDEIEPYEENSVVFFGAPIEFIPLDIKIMDPKSKWIKEGRCPECGVLAPFVRGAMKCPEHGVYGGC